MRSDPAADAVFREMYDATFDDVRRFCLRRLPASDVNDAISDVYLIAWQKADQIPQRADALPWLYGVARNVVRHSMRGTRRRFRLAARARSEPSVPVPGPDVQVVRRSEDEELAAAIERLSGPDREVIRLRAWEGLKASEVAEVLGCSVAAAEKRIARAFKRLESELPVHGSMQPDGVAPPREGGS